ncbi:hypothetical protein [Shouchella miscanthi]|uniref:hypothetical protein n=1 Tax=Shouchella miscanthi TaxID=2598861 RepID=UPI0011A61E54|nr:hypothetical protein [Shouchella miscanthi]
MRKSLVYGAMVSLTSVTLLSACGGNEEDGNGNEPTDENENAEVEAEGYSHFDEISIEGHVADTVFYISENGDTLLWGEKPGQLTNIESSKVWMNGETKEADIPEREHPIQPMLSESGMIVYSHSDSDRPIEERNWVAELNPSTEEVTEFYMDNDWDQYVVTMGSNYSEDPRRVISSRNHYDDEVVHMYLWDMDSNEVKEIDLTETVANEVDLEELSAYPHGAITSDGTEMYAVLADVGILHYNLEDDTSEFIHSAEVGFFANNEKSQTSILTSDDRYILYAMLEDRRMTHFAYSIESGESIELGEGIATYPLTDGTIMMFTYDDEFIHFNLDTDTTATAHTPELGEDDRIDSFTVSSDGTTLAYAVRDEKNETVIQLVRN